VLVMTGLGDEATLAAARAAGCHGVVTKDRAAQDLVEGIRALASGVALTEPEPSAPRPGKKLPTEGALSSREREVLTHLAAGQSTADIAGALGISATTVRNHIQRILPKLGAHSRLEAVALGIQAGIIAPPADRRAWS
jgi:two-component system, NarL family, nitrate/nitrite response regulator NarL